MKVDRHTCGALLVVALLLLSPHSAWAEQVLFYGEDFDDGVAPGWITEDITIDDVTKFHVDTYLAFDDPDVAEDHSWWCGELNPTFSGGDGYGNGWDQRLELPPIDVGFVVTEDRSWGTIKARYRDGVPEHVPTPARTAILPVLTYAYRHDSEPGYDYTYVQHDSLGTWRDLNEDYDGSSGGWQDTGPYGFDLTDCSVGGEIRLRFRFLSDGAGSDEDGLYLSDGGAFHVDNILVYDFISGQEYFFENCECGIGCTPRVREPAGDYWHLVADLCSAHSDPYSWWCGDDADTNLIPPNLQNSLTSPVINIADATTCTLRRLVHAEVPPSEGDYWTEEVSLDGGVTWHQTHRWGMDFGGCDGWGTYGISGTDLTSFLPEGDDFKFRITMYTSNDGCGPGVAGGAGINLDDIWLEGSDTQI